MTTKKGAVLGAVLAVLAAALGSAAPASAGTLTVTNTDGSGAGSLREAIQAANDAAGADAIQFAPGVAGTIALNSPLPTLAQDVTISGPGADTLTVRREDSVTTYSVFLVDVGATAEISGLTIRGGEVDGGASGGGIANLGTLTVRNSVIEHNREIAGAGGGGIGNLGTLTLAGSTVAFNDAALGGGGIHNTGSLTVRNSTIARNEVTAGDASGAGGIWSDGTATIESSTLADNENPAGAANLYRDAGSVTLRSTIVDSTGLDPPRPDCAVSAGGFESEGFNLDSDGSCGLGEDTDQSAVDPGLGSLTGNYGPTPTMLPATSGPAIDRGDGTVSDQRGFERPFDSPGHANAAGGNGADVGAVELQPGELDPFTVITTADSGPGSLRHAIRTANDLAGPETISFAVGLGGTIALASALPGLTDVTIVGPGADELTVRRDAVAPFPIFETGEPNEVEISGLSIAGGNNGLLSGGGVLNRGELTLRRSAIVENAAAGGAGIHNAATGELKLVASTISANTVPGSSTAAGLHNAPGAVATITNSTITGNTATAAPTTGGGISNSGSLTIENSTVARNSSPISLGAANLSNLGSGTTTLTSTIVAEPLGGAANCTAGIGSAGFNLASDASCFPSGATDQASVDPGLGALASNGGPTRTMKPDPTGPAVDRGIAGAGVTVDQRGFDRPLDSSAHANAGGGDGTDIGAVELGAAELSTPAPQTNPPPTGDGTPDPTGDEPSPGTSPPPDTTPDPTASQAACEEAEDAYRKAKKRLARAKKKFKKTGTAAAKKKLKKAKRSLKKAKREMEAACA